MRIKRSRILLLGVFIYLICQLGTTIIGKSIKTVELYPQKEQITQRVKGMIIRDEHVVKSNQDGFIQRNYEEGDKVKKSQNIVSIYEDNDTPNLNNKINEKDEEIDSLKKELKTEKNNLNKQVIENKIKTKNDQKEIIKKQLNQESSYIKTNTTGIISYKYDNNEEKYSIKDIKKIKKQDLESEKNSYIYIEEKNHIKKDDPIARIINNNEIYIVIFLEEDKEENFSRGKNIEIKLGNEILSTKVEEIQKNKDELKIILKITNENVGIYDTRVEEFDIIYKQIDTLKVPKSSVKLIDNKKGVYKVNDQTKDIEFIELKNIQFENDDFIFIDYYKNNIEDMKSVEIYDEILINPNIINTNMKIK